MNDRRSANPFAIQGRISDPRQFIGRRDELDQISDLLRTMQPVSLVGERRIGKSSLLYHIFQTGKRWFGNEVTVVYTDLPGTKDEPAFYECCCRALQQIDSRIHLDSAKPINEYRMRDLENAVRGCRVVLWFDEFEKVLRSSVFPRDFYDSLRSLAQFEGSRCSSLPSICWLILRSMIRSPLRLFQHLLAHHSPVSRSVRARFLVSSRASGSG